MKLKKLTFTFFLLTFILLNISLVIASKNTKNNIDNYFRIHVVANSDSIEDQILKLNVAKNIEEYIASLTKGITNKSDYIRCISDNIYNILQIAKNIILENNMNYDVYAYIGNIKYDEKSKDDITMEAGIYNSLKVVIGDGQGENWWSLLFPNSIDGVETTEIISNEKIEYSFGIIDYFTSFIDILKMN